MSRTVAKSGVTLGAHPLLNHWWKNAWIHHGTRVLVAAAVTAAALSFDFDKLEYTTYDWRMYLSPRPATSGHVTLVSIDHDTLTSFKHEPNAREWRRAIDALHRADPARVVSFVNPSHVHGTGAEIYAFAEMARRAPVTYGENDLPKHGMGRLEALPPPFENVPVAPAPKTSDRKVLAKDGVTRRLILSWEDALTLHARLAREVNGAGSPRNYHGVFGLLDSQQMLIRYRAPGAYPRVHFADVAAGRFDPALVRGKIVLIGHDMVETANDYVATPLASDPLGLGLSQLEMHANVLDTLILDQAPRPLPEWVNLVLTFLVALLMVYAVLSLRPTYGFLALGATVGVYAALATAVFAGTWYMIPVAHPLVATFVCYYFVIPYRLLMENRRGWNLRRKNEVLMQVEELKSNFMRLMSHDLKTPLARIQGMADVIAQEPNALTATQRQALAEISNSGEELTKYIGSILSLSRIEAKEVKLNRRSRDVNELAREVIARLDHLARRRRIEIVTEFEPLFSIKVDADLIKVALTNLIENAIKYSHEGSRILVSSEESDGAVVLQVADQGRGIAPADLPHVFDRFFRARDARQVSHGHGLGLYLAKYFVELHGGRLEVESVVDEGSTFTMTLHPGGPA